MNEFFKKMVYNIKYGRKSKNLILTRVFLID